MKRRGSASQFQRWHSPIHNSTALFAILCFGVMRSASAQIRHVTRGLATDNPSANITTAGSATAQRPSSSREEVSARMASSIIPHSDKPPASHAPSTSNDPPTRSLRSLPTPPKLDEIIITAEKRAQTILTTPESVTVIDSRDLQNLGATTFSGFANTIPGLSYQTSGSGYTQITLRGVTTGFDVSPTVGIYLDDVPIGSSTAFAQGAQVPLDVGLFDIKRIDVLRGPQGTLYGASTLGGLIKYVTKEPNINMQEREVRAGLSDTPDGGISYDTSIDVNQPVPPLNSAIRADVYYAHDGGYIDNIALHDGEANRAGTIGARLDVLIMPLDTLSIRITGFLQNILRDGESTVNYLPGGQPEYGDLSQYRIFAEPYDQHFHLGSVVVDYKLPWATLTSTSSYQTMEESNVWDISEVYIPLLSTFFGTTYGGVGLGNGSGTDKAAEELRLVSKKTRPVTWILGGFYTHESSWYAENFLLKSLAGGLAPNDLYQFWSPSMYREYAFFGDVTWTMLKKLDITGGLRYANNSQTYTQYGSGLLIGSLPTGRSQEGVFTYLADASYHISGETNTYFRYATGYRPGGPNLAARNPTTGAILGSATFGADTLRSYEVGLKSESPRRRITVNVDAYHIAWSNIQIFALRDGFGFRANAPGGASIDGAELMLALEPVRQLRVTGALSYQHAYMRQADADLGASGGERLPNVPRFSANIAADYVVSSNRRRPSLGLDVNYVGERPASFDRSPSYPQYILPAYARVDAHAGFEAGATHVQLFVHNLFNRRGQLADMLPQFGTRVAILQPRTIGLNVSVDF